MTARLLASLACAGAIWLAAPCHGAAEAQEGTPESARGASLEQRLASESAKLAKLKAELEALTGGESTKVPAVSKPEPTKAAPATSPSGSEQADEEPTTPLLDHPDLIKGDVLYRLGRHEEARAIYEAMAQNVDLPVDDRVWALLQAGNACRRLGDFDAAIAHLQSILHTYPRHPLAKSHVPWAVKTAQWEKRWERLEPPTGE